MDFLRRPYTTQCRFWLDSDETADIVWYPCLPGVPDLDRVTPFMSRDWQSEIWPNADIGEVFGADRKFNKEPAKPAAKGHHVCGTDEEWLGLPAE